MRWWLQSSAVMYDQCQLVLSTQQPYLRMRIAAAGDKALFESKEVTL